MTPTAVLKPCPHCGRDPIIETCEPWPKGLGPQPWHVGCYQGGNDEHYIGADGDTRAEAIANWDREVAATLCLPMVSLRQEGRDVRGHGAGHDE